MTPARAGAKVLFLCPKQSAHTNPILARVASSMSSRGLTVLIFGVYGQDGVQQTAPNGRELFFVAPDGSLMAVRGDARGSSWKREGSAVRVVQGPYMTMGAGSSRNYDVSGDGKRFLMVKQPFNQAAASQIIVVQNWLEELKRLVPTR